jgi:hypothetical protein
MRCCSVCAWCWRAEVRLPRDAGRVVVAAVLRVAAGLRVAGVWAGLVVREVVPRAAWEVRVVVVLREAEGMLRQMGGRIRRLQGRVLEGEERSSR